MQTGTSTTPSKTSDEARGRPFVGGSSSHGRGPFESNSKSLAGIEGVEFTFVIDVGVLLGSHRHLIQDVDV